ncbi:MAG: NTP transferase domain-containing protein [Spirochaetales bacterium]|nr:NTP transferase domain-containing protein [Spirochaetales bacterium]
MLEFPGNIRVPQSVMVGSVGRNTGKTEFACALIRSLARRTRVFAVKVTTIYEGRVSCVRGDEGCGVCTSMDCEWLLTEEFNKDRAKDTSRMLAAGADRVWWLRVREGSLADAARELTRLIPEGGVLVFESNSIRRVCEPDLFFMLGDPAVGEVKESARSALKEVDRVVAFDGRSFNFDVESVALKIGRCVYPRDAGAIVLAGGRSSRMGTDKRLLNIDGLPLVEHVYRRLEGTVGEVLVSVAGAACPGIPGARRIVDRFGNAGPMGGVASALEQSRYDVNFVTACDIPAVPLGFIGSLLRRSRNHQVVVPVDEAGRYEPLFAVYSKSVLPRLRRLLEDGERRIRMLYDQVDTCRIDIPPGIDLRNLNTKADYRAYLAG